MQLQTRALELDVLAYAHTGLPLTRCAGIIKAGIARQLQAMQASMSASASLRPHCVCLFSPPGLGHCISVTYPFSKAGGEVAPRPSHFSSLPCWTGGRTAGFAWKAL